MTVHAALVVPDRELWSGQASTVIAKTSEGDIGVLTGHSPVFGVLTEGSVAEIVTDETISSFKAVTEGKYDNLPEQAFYMVGGIEDAERKARELEQ